MSIVQKLIDVVFGRNGIKKQHQRCKEVAIFVSHTAGDLINWITKNGIRENELIRLNIDIVFNDGAKAMDSLSVYPNEAVDRLIMLWKHYHEAPEYISYCSHDEHCGRIEMISIAAIRSGYPEFKKSMKVSV